MEKSNGSHQNAFKDLMDVIRVESMEGKSIELAVSNNAPSVLRLIYDVPSDCGLSCTNSVTLLEKENNQFLLIVRGLSQPGRHKVVSFTDSARWQDALVQFASDVESERIEWKADEPRSQKAKASFYDTITG